MSGRRRMHSTPSGERLPSYSPSIRRLIGGYYRYAKEARAAGEKLVRAWRDTARKEDSVLAKTTRDADRGSDIDEEDRPPKRKRIV